MMTTQSSEDHGPADLPPVVTSIAELSASADAWICDIWGVMHNGVTAYSAAVDACLAYRAQGGRIILLTNAPRPAASVAAQLQGFGVPEEAYDAILTSGDMTRTLIAAHLPKPLFQIGRAHV